MKGFDRFRHQCQKRHRNRLPSISPARRVKRKIDRHRSLTDDITCHVDILVSCSNSTEPDRAAAKGAIQNLADLVKNEETANLVVECGAVPPLVRHLRSPEPVSGQIPLEHEVEERSAYALKMLAIIHGDTKTEHQQLIVDAGGLPHLVNHLKRHTSNQIPEAVKGVIFQAASAIHGLAYDNKSIKNLVRNEGGIPPLVELLQSVDTLVQGAAAKALAVLADENDENINEMVACDAPRTLLLMLRSSDDDIRHKALIVITLLAKSSLKIRTMIAAAGVLQPVIESLSSSCLRCSAARLLGELARDTDCKVHIAQRGALRPLIHMLHSQDPHLKECAAFALLMLALDNTQNQAAIAESGGVKPLLKLLDTKYRPFYSLQCHSAETLDELATNEDCVGHLIKAGCVEILQDTDLDTECIPYTLERLEEHIQGGGWVLDNLLYFMRRDQKATQRRHVTLALAHLCSPNYLKTIFVDNGGLDLLLELLEPSNSKYQDASLVALCKLADKAGKVSSTHSAPPSSPVKKVCLGEQYVNNPTFSDVTFLVEGKRFYAHRICLIASSDTFRAMFDGSYRERNAQDIVIPNYTWQAFELMMRYMYTGSINITCLELNVTQDLLRAADQYLVDGLKQLCEDAIARDMSVENVSVIFDISQAFNVASLRQSCILFILNNQDKLNSKSWFLQLIQRILPETRQYFFKALNRDCPVI